MIVQSYSMADHFRSRPHTHNGGLMGAELQELVRLRAHEREYTLQLINKKENRVKLPCCCSDPNCECKKGGK